VSATKIKLTDSTVSKLKFANDNAGYVVRDNALAGFFVRVGKRRKVYRFQRDVRDKLGKRRTESINLGTHGAVTGDEARQKVLHLLGKAAQGEFSLRPPKGILLGTAFDRFKSSTGKRGKSKSPRWIKECERCYERNLRPWHDESLRDLSNDPDRVRSWHIDVQHQRGPSEANHAGRLLRAIYQNAISLDRSLPAANPTSGIAWCPEDRADLAIPFNKFPLWAAQVRDVETDSPLRAAYHRFCVLTGMRPGEAARLPWEAINCVARTIMIGKSKTGADITIPMSSAIARELAKARDAGRELWEERSRVWVFPARGVAGHLTNWQENHRQLDYLGDSGRHTYRTVAADLGIDDLTIHLLMGHSLRTVSQGYITRSVMVAGTSLRSAQRRISQRVVELMNGKETKAFRESHATLEAGDASGINGSF
jgi:integrase